MPNIISTMIEDEIILIIQMREKFCDYTVMVTLPIDCWQALKDMCECD